eukprot:6195487-Pleurochrysis_carterae.AAC.3
MLCPPRGHAPPHAHARMMATAADAHVGVLTSTRHPLGRHTVEGCASRRGGCEPRVRGCAGGSSRGSHHPRHPSRAVVAVWTTATAGLLWSVTWVSDT